MIRGLIGGKGGMIALIVAVIPVDLIPPSCHYAFRCLSSRLSRVSSCKL